jgi:tungstate transport system substrate-binding protein
MSFEDVLVDRRKFLRLATTALAVGSTILAQSATAHAADATAVAALKAGEGVSHPGLLRIASVPTSVEGGLLPILVERFKSETGLQVLLIADDDPYNLAKQGKVDLVVSHFGHRDAEAFVMKGFGLWPQTAFSNQLGLFGPVSDPAKIRGMTDLVKAFQKIAAAKAPYVVNDTKGISYLTEILWNAAGKPPLNPWFIDPKIGKSDAIALAVKHKAYVFWGLTPFLREAEATHRVLVPLVTADPLLQRVMVSVVVNPERVTGVNPADAVRFQKFLLSPVTQASIMKINYPGIEQALWAPAGRHNSGSILPR